MGFNFYQKIKSIVAFICARMKGWSTWFYCRQGSICWAAEEPQVLSIGKELRFKKTLNWGSRVDVLLLSPGTTHNYSNCVRVTPSYYIFATTFLKMQQKCEWNKLECISWDWNQKWHALALPFVTSCVSFSKHLQLLLLHLQPLTWHRDPHSHSWAFIFLCTMSWSGGTSSVSIHNYH